jgi:GNAT superfamily N-acetyltransferase
MSFIIRPVVTADIGAMFHIRTSVRENAMSYPALIAAGITPGRVADLLAGTGAGWIARADTEDAGFALADAQAGMIFALFVLPQHEGKGIGRALLRPAEDWLAAQGWREIWLETGGDPALRAAGFYRHMGWQEDGIAPNGQRRFRRSL